MTKLDYVLGLTTAKITEKVSVNSEHETRAPVYIGAAAGKQQWEFSWNGTRQSDISTHSVTRALMPRKIISMIRNVVRLRQ